MEFQKQQLKKKIFFFEIFSWPSYVCIEETIDDSCEIVNVLFCFNCVLAFVIAIKIGISKKFKLKKRKKKSNPGSGNSKKWFKKGNEATESHISEYIEIYKVTGKTKIQTEEGKMLLLLYYRW